MFLFAFLFEFLLRAIFILGVLIPSGQIYAQTVGLRTTHPVSLQHMLPTGESPGWSKDSWVEFAVTDANHWAATTTFKNTKTGKDLTFTADYEQTSLFAEIGKAISPNTALVLEVPYAARHEGATSDQWIVEYHNIMSFDNFGRTGHPYGQKIFETSTDGVRRGPYEAPSGAGNIKLKLKYWAIKNTRNTGLGFGVHVKVPIEDEEKGMTSGGFDYTLMTNYAFPMGSESLFYSTLALTYAKKNWMFEDWPRNQLLWMVDFVFDVGFGPTWSVLLDLGFYSPLMRKDNIEIQYTGTTDKEQAYEKVASGYNALVQLRGQQMLGLRRKFGQDNYWMFYLMEDWGPGDKDNNNDMVFSSGQPDFGIGTKLVFNF